MHKIKIAAFDCDGVLFDTLEANRAFYNHILEHFERPLLDADQLNYVHMHTAEGSLAYLFKDPKDLEAAQAFRLETGYLPFIEYMQMEPYLQTVLRRLKKRYRIALVTNRSDTIQPILERFDLKPFFDLVVSALDVRHPKPHPEPLNKVMRHFKVSADQIVYVGDSRLDEESARAAGIPFVAFNNARLQARWHVNRLDELLTVLKA